jgi:hypothetical protein
VREVDPGAPLCGVRGIVTRGVRKSGARAERSGSREPCGWVGPSSGGRRAGLWFGPLEARLLWIVCGLSAIGGRLG